MTSEKKGAGRPHGAKSKIVKPKGKSTGVYLSAPQEAVRVKLLSKTGMKPNKLWGEAIMALAQRELTPTELAAALDSPAATQPEEES